MISLFSKKKYKDIDKVLEALEMNLSNNYKDLAISSRNELEKLIVSRHNEGTLIGKDYEKYNKKLISYTEKMKGYHH
ncbi:MAG: hypothetical protein IKL73_07635 [Lachnospiraceae bacterium]|nr:hypothetical protein [Lachnospiraceae bacterium]MBR6698115.1 hypothetical protein [Lachnospiraceae bacterium]